MVNAEAFAIRSALWHHKKASEPLAWIGRRQAEDARECLDKTPRIRDSIKDQSYSGAVVGNCAFSRLMVVSKRKLAWVRWRSAKKNLRV